MPKTSKDKDEEDAGPHVSPTLEALAASDPDRLPSSRVVCAGCPNAVWHSSGPELRCYCKVFFAMTWDSTEPGEITACDGLFL